MKFTKIHRLSVVTAVGALLSLIPTGEAQAYTFTKIADSSNFPPIGVCCSSTVSFFNSAAINNYGTVVFGGDLPRDHNNLGNVNNPRYGILVGNGGSLTTITDTYGSQGIGSILADPDINDLGTVSFWAYLSSPRTFPFGPNGIFTGSSGEFTFVSSSSEGFIISEKAVINNQGTVVFFGDGFLKDGILLNNNGLVTTIATSAPNSNDISSPWSYLSNPTINDENSVAFNGVLKNGVSGIFTYSNGLFTTIADSSGMFNNYWGKPAINNQETVAFIASLDTGGFGIFTNSGGNITTIFDSSSSLRYPGSVAINNKGNLAFSASLDVGGYGIFTGLDPVVDKVIGIGDTLFGSKVKKLGFRQEGFNDGGQVAFWAVLENGIQGIYRADPEPPKSVPEPTSVLGFLAVSILPLVKRINLS